MSDKDEKQPKFTVSTTAGVVVVDADNATEAAIIARGVIGGSVLGMKGDANAKAAEKAAAAAAAEAEEGAS